MSREMPTTPSISLFLLFVSPEASFRSKFPSCPDDGYGIEDELRQSPLFKAVTVRSTIAIVWVNTAKAAFPPAGLAATPGRVKTTERHGG